MNNTEHLLTCLAEECAEVAKECGKALRFGIEDKVTRDPLGPRGTEGPNNGEKISGELIDLIAVYGMCVDKGLLPDLGITFTDVAFLRMIAAKKRKVAAYMDYAVRVGALEIQNTKEESHV